MHVTFPRLPDHEVGYSVVERDDGVVYQLLGGRAGTALPHDIVHLVVERELGVTDGIWGGIAAGMVFGSMRHVGGRRPPHVTERSVLLKRTYRDRVMRAELLGNLVEAIAALDAPSAAEIRRLTGTKLSVLRMPEPPSPQAFATAARALQVEAARWARLRPGEELRYEWTLPVTHVVPRPRDPSAPGARRDPRRRLGGRGVQGGRSWRPGPHR